MEELYEQGKIRAIGVSNFYPDRYIDLVRFTDVVPVVNQVETHVFNQQLDAHEIMEKYGTQIESWGPFAEGGNDLFTNETLRLIGDKYNKTAAQVALRYLLQRGIVVIPKTTHKDRMIQNLDVFDFGMTEEDMETIKSLDKKESAFFSHYDPKLVEMLVNRD